MSETATQEDQKDLDQKTEDGVLTITLDRPDKLNALTPEMMKDIRKAVKGAEREKSVRVIVITGEGRAFSAGADLGHLKDRYKEGVAPELGKDLEKYFNPMIRAIRACEKPVVAEIQGLAAGAGASLALACDIKYCSATAKFISAFIQVGLVPDSGFTHTLARTLGHGLALEHAWTGKPITPSLAEKAGMVNRVVAADELHHAVVELVAKLKKAPPKAVALTKRAINKAYDGAFDAQLDYEMHMQDTLGRTKDHLEGVTAFFEKREPRFTGE